MGRITAWALALCVSTLAVASEPATEQGLTAAQIVEKNVAARGGLEAWRKIHSMVWVGRIDNANAPAPSVPFVLEMKRPNKERFEIKAQGQTSVRMYDGIHGWKLRPSSYGRPEMQPYNPDELRFARDGQGFDGPLIDYQAKGIAVALDGVDEIDGHKAYRLSVKMPSGISNHVWVDAKTFLDIKYDRVSRNKFGRSNTVSVFYRDYKTVEGLQIPFVIETGADTAKATERLVIDKVSLNPLLEDRMFAKPGVTGWRSKARVDIDAPRSVRQSAPSGPSLPTGFPRLSSRSLSGSGVVQ